MEAATECVGTSGHEVSLDGGQLLVLGFEVPLAEEVLGTADNTDDLNGAEDVHEFAKAAFAEVGALADIVNRARELGVIAFEREDRRYEEDGRCGNRKTQHGCGRRKLGDGSVLPELLAWPLNQWPWST